MNDTQKRIAKYKNALPRMKEKVAAVALLLAMSATMLVTVSFAWLALSQSPEVTGVKTAIASNGNLEIALVGAEGLTPYDSKVGDSNKELIARNITWGNLVNLSDPAYGLDNIVLRPATLNRDDLLGSPLKGAIYTQDGRVEQFSSSFAYASWIQNADGLTGYFEIPQDPRYGVRAIASTKMAASSGYAYEYETRRAAAQSANSSAGSAYIAITQNQEWMETLAYVMGTYMTASLNATQGNENLTNPTIDKDEINRLRDMFGTFIDAFDLEAKALAELANFQLFVINNGDTSAYTPYTAETLMASSANDLSKAGVQISNFTTSKTGFVADYNTLKTDYAKLCEICDAAEFNAATIKWTATDGVEDSNLSDIVDDLVTVGSCTLQIKGSTDTPKKISSIGATDALNYKDKSCYAVITNGILKRFEERTGERMSVGDEYNNGKGLKVDATGQRYGMSMNASVYALISTNAQPPSLFATDLKYAEDKNTGGEAVLSVKDTYGIAIDLWVRTNAAGTYLTLEGNVLTVEEEVPVTGKDMNGNTTQIYTASITVQDEAGESVTYTVDVYKMTAGDGTETWYDAGSHEVYDVTKGTEPKEKIEIVEKVVGYEGDNRVWEDRVNAGLSVNSTTQGSGSCYVYYADTPEDQARSLQLLKELKVAFVDDRGNLLATAYMDTSRYYADNGKVTVPMALESNGISLGTDENGDPILAITALEKNVATRITALVYLDGANLDNDDVLSSADIEGQLNIQFGSSQKLEHIDNETLRLQEVDITATIDQTSFNYDTAPEGSMVSNVELSIDGYEPKKVTAFFIRSINSTQGSREKEMTFEYSGSWKASYTFDAPGTYVLRSVQLDGIDYEVEAPPIVITSEGFTLKSLTWTVAEGGNSTTIMTANKSESVKLDLQFVAADQDKMPKSVVGRFQRSGDGIVSNVRFTYDPTTGRWSGTATFLTSGDYTLQYLVLDGETVEIPENLRKYATVYLGMKVRVGTESPTRFMYEPDNMTDNQKNLYMNLVIMDDTGREMPGLTDIKLYYGKRGTSLAERGMDAGMTWVAADNRYEGVFNSKIGMFDFLRVVVGENVITEATSSPSFIIQSPIPPTFNSDVTPSFQYAPTPATAPAKLSVKLNDAEALSNIKAVLIKDGTELETLVDGVLDNSGNWTFAIPIDENGGQDGRWSIKEIRIAEVYSADGVEYTEENPLVFDNANYKFAETNVVSKLVVKLDSEENISVNGSFLESHTLNKFGITVTDKYGNALPGITDITMNYTYKQDSAAKGGYTINDFTTGMGDFTVTMTGDGNGTHFTQQTATSLKYAGTYEITRITFSIGEDTTIPVMLSGEALPKAPTVTVNSIAPSVTVTGISPTGSNPTSVTYTTKNLSWGMGTEPTFTAATNMTSSFDQTKNEATIYAVATADNSTQRHGSFTRPTLTLTVAGVDNGCAVSLTLPGGSANEIVFSRTGNGTITQTLGRVAQIKSWTSYFALTHTLDAYYGHGDQTIQTMTIVRDGVTYTVTMDKPLVIHNPNSVNQS